MRICCFDPFGGIAGDMTLAALIDAGCDLGQIQRALDGVGIPQARLRVEPVRRQSIAAKALKVEGRDDQSHRHLDDILRVIQDSHLTATAKRRATAIFKLLGEAEAGAHGTSLEKVHFHEIGALDSLVDIIGTAVATDLLAIDEFYATSPPLPRGSVMTQHGELPLPAPATLRLMEGLPVRPQAFEGETVTPTGAAILRGLRCRFEPPPPMRVHSTGVGAGTREFPIANVLRVIIGETQEAGVSIPAEPITVIEATIDDMNPQLYEPLGERLSEAGAVEVFLTPVQMKKSRPGVLVTVLAFPESTQPVAAALLAHSTTIGCRVRSETRYRLPRETVQVQTVYGPVRVKVVDLDGIRRGSPEFEDVKALALKSKVPVANVLAEAEARIVEEVLGERLVSPGHAEDGG